MAKTKAKSGVEMDLSDAQAVLKALNYAKAEGFSVKKAQEKIEEVMESPDDFEADAKKASKNKTLAKLIDTIWDAIDEDQEITVVEDEEDADDDDESDEDDSDDDDDESDDDEDEESDDDDDDEEDEPVKKGKKGAKASKNGKPSKNGKDKKKEKKASAVERDEFGRSVNSQAHTINEAITKEGQTAAEIAEETGANLASVTTHLRNLVQQEYINCKKVGGVIQFFRKGGKAVAKADDDDDDDKPVKKNGKAKKNGKKDEKKAAAGKKGGKKTAKK
jgi:hypothetical protein